VKIAFECLLQQLKSDSSKVRYLTLLLVNELFLRSGYFRMLLVQQLDHFLEHTIGIRKELPPPLEMASMLKKEALFLVKKWSEMFGEKYKQLVLGYHCTIQIRPPSFIEPEEKACNQKLQERYQRISLLKLNGIQREMEEIVPDILINLEQMNNCFSILFPDWFQETISRYAYNNRRNSENPSDTSDKKFNELFKNHISYTELENENVDDRLYQESSTEESDNEQYNSDHSDKEDSLSTINQVIRRHGLGSSEYELLIEIDVNPKKQQASECSENSAVFETLRDCLKLAMNRHIPLLKEWTSILIELNIMDQLKPLQEQLLKKAIDLKNNILQVETKCKEMNIIVTDKFQRTDSEANLTETRCENNKNNGTNVNNDCGSIYPIPLGENVSKLSEVVPKTTTTYKNSSTVGTSSHEENLMSANNRKELERQMYMKYIDYESFPRSRNCSNEKCPEEKHSFAKDNQKGKQFLDASKISFPTLKNQPSKNKGNVRDRLRKRLSFRRQ